MLNSHLVFSPDSRWLSSHYHRPLDKLDISLGPNCIKETKHSLLVIYKSRDESIYLRSSKYSSFVKTLFIVKFPRVAFVMVGELKLKVYM